MSAFSSTEDLRLYRYFTKWSKSSNILKVMQAHSINTYLIIPFPKPVTIFEKVCSRGFSEPFWLICKGSTKQLHTASATTWILGCRIKLKSYQINNHLFSIANNLWIKVPLEAIHLKESTIHILNTCYRRILLNRNTNWYIKITKITMHTIYILNCI